jgi:AcrR family transcriptional regulator
MPSPSNTRVAILEATIRLIARGGLRAVSHRAIEAEAGLSHGSTTYHFGNRQNIVDAVLAHLAEHDTRTVTHARQALSAEPSVDSSAERDADIDIDQVADLMVALISGDTDHALARYELMLEVARRPELRASLLKWRLGFVADSEAMLTRLGAPNPPLAARWWIAALDGLILDDLCAGTLEYRTHARTLFRAMLRAAIEIPNHAD